MAGPEPGTGGRPPVTPRARREWQTLLEGKIIPRVVEKIVAGGKWSYFIENTKYSHKTHYKRVKGGQSAGGSFSVHSRTRAVRIAQRYGREVFETLTAAQKRKAPARWDFGINAFVSKVRQARPFEH